MAVNITSTYAGTFAGSYISAALLSGNTIANGGIEVKPNIKFKEVIKKVTTSGLIVDASCDFTSAGSVTLTERIIQPEYFQVNQEMCLTPFQSDWEAAEMGYSAFDNLPPKFSDFIIGQFAAEVAAKTESNIWSGVTGNVGEFDGFTALMTADADVIDVVAGAVTVGNVVVELQKIVDAIPAALFGREDLYIYVSQNIAKAYIGAMGALGGGIDNRGALWFQNGQPLSFGGIPLFVANGLASNRAVAAEKSNLFFGTSLLSDQNEVRLLDMRDLDGSQNVRLIMRFAAAVQYGIGSDIVLYS
tara:strand:- start:159 stop:1064 length:906 start_codon:yes stop_codon:yes gene_type:complete